MVKSVLMKEYEKQHRTHDSTALHGEYYSHEYVWWLEKELTASRESRTLCDVPPEEEMGFTREWWYNENKDRGDLTKDELWNISGEAAEVLIKYHNYRMSRRHVV